MNKKIIIILFISIFIIPSCKKNKLYKENLYGTWEKSIDPGKCNELDKVQITLSENSIASINYRRYYGGGIYCPCRGFWRLEKKSKKYYLTFEFPDSCGIYCISGSSSQDYDYCTYKIDYWNDKDCCGNSDCIGLTCTERIQGQDYLCSILPMMGPLQTKLTKIN
jgi:hypothetical protein